MKKACYYHDIDLMKEFLEAEVLNDKGMKPGKIRVCKAKEGKIS